MAVKIRLKRLGRSKRPFYRIHAIDRRSARDSRSIEELGYYDPIDPDLSKALKIKHDRVKYWLSVGAQPSDTVRSLLKKSGLDSTTGQAVTTST